MFFKTQNMYDSLTDAEQKVADIIQKHNVNIIKKTTREIAEEAYVAPSAVIRFCKKVGFRGLSELKRALVEDFAKEGTNIDKALPISKNDTVGEIFVKTFKLGAATLKSTVEVLNFRQIEKVVDEIIRAKRVVFFGVGTSSVIALDGHYRFSQMGIPSSYCSDPLFMNVTAANLCKDDLAICVSHSGKTKAVVDAMRRANNSGAVTVAITSFENNILATESKYSIVTFADEDKYPVEAVSAGIAHMCIVDAFMMSIAKVKYKELSKHISARNEILKNIRY